MNRDLEKLESAMRVDKLKESVAKAESALKKWNCEMFKYADSIRLLEERVSKLEQVSGKSIDELTVLFAAGWKLREPTKFSDLLSMLDLEE